MNKNIPNTNIMFVNVEIRLFVGILSYTMDSGLLIHLMNCFCGMVDRQKA